MCLLLVLFLWKNPNAVYLPNIQIMKKKSIKKKNKKQQQQQKLPPLKSIPPGQLRSYDMRFASSHHSRPRHLCSPPPNESGQLRYFGSLVSWKASNRSEQACCLRDSGRLPWLVHGVHELAMQGPISSRRNSASHTLRNFKLHVRGMPRHPHQSTCASISALLHIPSLFKRTRFFVVITASQRGGSR